MKRLEKIKNLGYEVMVIWEHNFHEETEKNPSMKAFIEGLDVQDRLRPRDSFFGGRTTAAKLHYKTQGREKIKYVDFTSLYPYVNTCKQYPIGHPTIITSDFQPISQYFGIAKVRVLPPRGLYHPVLPYVSGGKLKFPLCRTCADKEHQEICQCSEEQRSFVGTWCTPELLKAQEKGYVVTKIYEVYHWPESTQHNASTGEGGLFSNYIKAFLKIKQEASGWPTWCQTEEDRNKYVDNYKQHQGIQLDAANIKKNPGLRSLAKLCLNSFWGKFGQRDNLKQSNYIYDADDLWKNLTDETKDIVDFHIINDDTIQLEWTHGEEFVPDDMKTNIFLATFTTCWARLELYTVLDALEERVLYYDTDSVIYVTSPGQYDPPVGDYLGDLTDELDGDNIEEFVSGGPKNYAYRTCSGKEICKVRGFTLNFKNSQLINFSAVRDLVLRNHTGTITTTNPYKICRDRKRRRITSRRECKDYKIVYTKRVIQPNLDTLPYGY